MNPRRAQVRWTEPSALRILGPAIPRSIRFAEAPDPFLLLHRPALRLWLGNQLQALRDAAHGGEVQHPPRFAALDRRARLAQPDLGISLLRYFNTGGLVKLGRGSHDQRLVQLSSGGQGFMHRRLVHQAKTGGFEQASGTQVIHHR